MPLAVAFFQVAPLRYVATSHGNSLCNHLHFILPWPYLYPMQPPNSYGRDSGIPGASKPSHWGDVPNGYQASHHTLRGSPNPSPINQPRFCTRRVLFGSLQGEERNPSFCEKNQTLHALIRQLGASSGDPLQPEARVDQGEGFPDPSLLWRSTKNPEEWCFGDFLGLPKESFNDTFDPFGDRNLTSSPLAAKISSQRPTILPSISLNGQTLPLSSSVQNSVAERRPVRTSRDVRSGRSSRPQHRRVLYFPHHRMCIMECSCKVWCRPCRRRPTPRLHSRLSWRL
ncbi:hypothetical protein Taro_013846, partial [Colocasia esculenta]|nr:hypothetical protein [Colocasia esculenta]